MICLTFITHSQQYSIFPPFHFNLRSNALSLLFFLPQKKSEEEYMKKIQGLLNGEAKLREKIKAAGIDYDFPGYAADVKAKGIQLEATSESSNAK